MLKWLKALNRARLVRRQDRKRAAYANQPPPAPVLPVQRGEHINLAALNWSAPLDVGLSVIMIQPGAAQDAAVRCMAGLHRVLPGAPLEVLLLADEAVAAACQALTPHWTVRSVAADVVIALNEAIGDAKGDWILLMDATSILLPGGTEGLMEAARAWPQAGVVVPKAVGPEGALEHAGGLISRDGHLEALGRAAHPERPEFNYRRECDFAPPPAQLLSKACWAAAGRFDARYMTVPFRHADFALRARAAGFRVVYEPRAQVVSSAKASTDLWMQGASAQNDRRLLLETHAQALGADHVEPGADALRARDRRAGGRQLLIIDHYVPEPDVDAGSRNIMEFLRTFLALGYVVKLWPKDLEATQPYTAQLQALGVEVLHGPLVYSFEAWVKANGQALDIVLLSRPTVAPDFIPLLRRYSCAKLVFYGHDLHFERMQREADIKQDPLIAKAATVMRETERDVWHGVDMVLYPSQEEVDSVKALSPGANAHFVPPFQFDSFPEPACAAQGLNLLMVAGFQHAPNVDAACWFVREVMPKVLIRHPAATLTLAGSNPTAEVMALQQDPHIEVTGQLSVEELAARYRRARVTVVPLRFGAGVKLKVVEAMQQGVPLVTTSTGLQGLPDVASAVKPTNDAETMAERISALLEDDEAWLEASRAQRVYVAERFSTAAMHSRFAALLGML